MTTGRLNFTSRIPRNGSCKKAQNENLALTLVSNFFIIAEVPVYPSEVRFTANPRDHPLTVTLRRGDTVEAIRRTEAAGPTACRKVDSLHTLYRCLISELGPNTAVLTVRPHPYLCRLACLWMGGRRWTRTRNDYKKRAALHALKRGASKASERQLRWTNADNVAAASLGAFAWKQVRRIVGWARGGNSFSSV